MDKLDKAVRIAAKIHSGLKGRSHEPEILHPLRVMMQMDNNMAKVVAVLHDTVESGKITIDELLQKGFSKKVCRAVDLLSRRKWESYIHYIDRVKTNPLAIKVKVADLTDNYQHRKNQKKLSKTDVIKMKKYRKAYKRLTGEKMRK